MKISDIKKLKWEKYEEWYEKWYDAELELTVFSKGKNPLAKLFSNHGLDALALNNDWYYNQLEDHWGKDRRNIFKKANKVFFKLVQKSERYIKNVEKIIEETKASKKIDEKVYKKIKKGFLILWYIFDIDLGEWLKPDLEQRLRARGLSTKQIEEVLGFCFSFKHPLGFQKEEEDLWRIRKIFPGKSRKDVLNFKNLPKNITRKLFLHCKKYRYLTGLEIDTKPYNEDDFYKKLINISQGPELKSKKKLPREIKNHLTKEDVKFIYYVHRHIYLDNYAADLRAKLDYLLTSSLVKHFDVSFRDLTYYTTGELEMLIDKGIKLNKDQLNKRKEFRVMVQINGKLDFFYGKKNYQKIFSLVNISKKPGNLTKFSGLVACPGKASGIVKIIRGASDLNKVLDKDILVASYTTPDLMPAIFRCAAIVTDHGGITSHAAIISRELRIPCIVGTKIATQVLKDGDLIEVDADHGAVRILN